MAGITTFLDESKMPNRTQEQKLFDNLVAFVFQNFPKWGREVNETLGAMNALLAGGAYALPYIFDTATADADPGAGKLRLSTATQNAATVMRLDLTAGGQDYTTLLDTMDSSTSVIKGSIRLVKQGDLSKWMTFDLTARAAPTGYRNLAVVCTDSSSASPFAKDDPLLLFFQRSGDKGEIGASGMVPLATATITSPVVSIDFLNLFSALYDKYTIEVQGLSSNANPAGANNSLKLHLAYGGQVDSALANYTNAAGMGSIYSSSSSTLTVEIRNANGGTHKGISVRGLTSTTGEPGSLMIEGFHRRTGACSGFRILATDPSGAVPLTAGTIRVYGHRNNP